MNELRAPNHAERVPRGSFDPLSWINERFRTNLKTESHIQVLSFSIIWNIFERELCDSKFSMEKFREKLEKTDLSPIANETEEMLVVFRDRYLDDGTTNKIFDTLFLEDKAGALVRRVLLKSDEDSLSKVLCVVTIVRRFRNNLFHGLKRVEDISFQENLFEMHNRYLAKLIELYSRDHS